MIREYGSPTLFLTFSCAEYESADIANYLRKINNVPPSYNIGNSVPRILYQYLKPERNSRSWRRPKAADGTPLSQSPAWGSADEMAKARARVEGVDERRRKCKASSMASERVLA